MVCFDCYFLVVLWYLVAVWFYLFVVVRFECWRVNSVVDFVSLVLNV